ncbi:MAG: acyltransferase [Armatimonadetes bacterium]|nr:acyltransferase [Armatimonadota bacterium]
MRRTPNFDLLRLFVALEVLWGHCANRFHGFAVFALLPVPAFVCLSGYLIPASFEASRSYGHFAAKRALRVMPAFLVSLILVYALFGTPALWPTFLTYLTAGAISAQYNGPLWSLMVEEILYAFHALTRRFFSIPVLGTLAVLTFPLMWWHPFANLEHFAAVESFFAGNLLYLTRNRWHTWKWQPLAAVALGLVSVYVLQITDLWIPASPFACAFVVMALHQMPQARIRIPDLSYGIYVYHYPVMTYCLARGFSGYPMAFTVLGSALTISLASWYLVEAPALSLKSRFAGKVKPGQKELSTGSPESESVSFSKVTS